MPGTRAVAALDALHRLMVDRLGSVRRRRQLDFRLQAVCHTLGGPGQPGDAGGVADQQGDLQLAFQPLTALGRRGGATCRDCDIKRATLKGE